MRSLFCIILKGLIQSKPERFLTCGSSIGRPLGKRSRKLSFEIIIKIENVFRLSGFLLI